MNAGRCCYVVSFVVVYTRDWFGGGGGGLIMSCEVRWMMMNAGRCCYVVSFVVVYRWVGGGVGGCDNVMWSALDDDECWKMLLRCKFRCCPQRSATAPWENQWCVRSCKLLQTAFVDMKMKKVRSSFRPWFSTQLSHVLLRNRNNKIIKTALQMVAMLYTTLVIHGRCKIFLFQHRQRLSSSAMKMELWLIKPFQRKT